MPSRGGTPFESTLGRLYNAYWLTISQPGLEPEMPYVAVHDPGKCTRCGACAEVVACPGAEELICIGCGACVLVCPNQALQLVEEPRQRRVAIEINGELALVPERISVKEAR